MREQTREGTGRIVQQVLAALFFAVLITALNDIQTEAATTETLLGDECYDYGEDYAEISLTYGDSGQFVPDEDAWAYYSLGEIISVQYATGNTSRLTVTESGVYEACGYGGVTVTVTVGYCEYEYDYDEDGEEVVYADTEYVTYKYVLRIYPNMDKVTLSKSEMTVYVSNDYYGSVTDTVKIKNTGSFTFSDSNKQTSLSVSSSSSKVQVSASVKKNVITMSFYGSGKSTIKVTLNDKIFKVKVTLKKVSCSTDSVLLAAGGTKTVKVKGKSSGTKVKWTSSNKKVATVSSSGKIKAKKVGNAIITATVNGQVKVGCVVNVTTAKKVKVVKKAIKIASTSTYSQSKRMQDGYYDCSSLVWKAYSAYGTYFGNKTYAPVAADLAKYLNSKNKLKGSFTYKDTQKMKMRAGDVIFKTGSDNGRYKGIYHAELFAGYCLYYYDYNGDPVVNTTWAARDDGYAQSGDLYGRP